MKIALLAAACALAAPAVLAQSGTVSSSTTIVTPGVTVSPHNSPVTQRPFRDGAIAAEQVVAPVAAVDSNTAVMGASPQPVIRYWFDVPKDVAEREDFRRWRGLL